MSGVKAIWQKLVRSLPLITVEMKASNVDDEILFGSNVKPTKFAIFQHYFLRRVNGNRAQAKGLLEDTTQKFHISDIVIG